MFVERPARHSVVTRAAFTAPVDSSSQCRTSIGAGRQPLAFDLRRQSNQRFSRGIRISAHRRRTAGGRDVNGNDELGVVDAAFTRQPGAGARRQQEFVDARRAPPGDAVGIRGEHGATKIDFRNRRRRLTTKTADGFAKLARDAEDVRWQPLIAIDRRQQVAGRRAVARRRGVTIGQQCAGTRGFRRAVGGNQEPAEARMDGQPIEIAAEGRERARRVDRVEAAQQGDGGRERVRGRRFVPRERQRIAAPGEDLENR